MIGFGKWSHIAMILYPQWAKKVAQKLLISANRDTKVSQEGCKTPLEVIFRVDFIFEPFRYVASLLLDVKRAERFLMWNLTKNLTRAKMEIFRIRCGVWMLWQETTRVRHTTSINTLIVCCFGRLRLFWSFSGCFGEELFERFWISNLDFRHEEVIVGF